MAKGTDKPKVGRPTKLNQAIIDAIVGDLQRGNYVETVAALNGIHKDTFYRWLKDGARELQRIEAGKRHPKGTHAATKAYLRLAAVFSDAVARACAEVEAEGVDVWREAFRRTVRVYDRQGNLMEEREEVDAAAVSKFLERRFPERWKGRSEQALVGADGGAVKVQTEQVDLTGLSDDDLRMLHALAQKAKPAEA